MNAYISNDGIPSQKVPFLLKKSSYRLFLYSLSLCFTAVSFFHSSTVHAANKKAQVPKDISSTLPVSKNISAEIQSLQLQKAEILAKSFNGNLNHCDPKNIQTAGSLKELTTLEEVFLDKFTGLSSYQVFQIDDPSSIDKNKLYTAVINGWVVEVRYVNNEGTPAFIHLQGPPTRDRSAPISCYYHKVKSELVVESEILSPNVGPANMVVRSDNRYITMYKNQSVNVDNLTQTIYSAYRKQEGKQDQLFRQEIWSTSKNTANLMTSASNFFVNSQPEGRPSFVQVRAFDHFQKARATGPNEVTVELINQNKVPLTLISNGKIISLPETSFLQRIAKNSFGSLTNPRASINTFPFGTCTLEIEKGSKAKQQSQTKITITNNVSTESDGSYLAMDVPAEQLLSLPDALQSAKCY